VAVSRSSSSTEGSNIPTPPSAAKQCSENMMFLATCMLLSGRFGLFAMQATSVIP
jgi:hypothetical protein